VMAQVADRYDFELLFTDNHSSDNTFGVLERLARRDPRVRALRFSRNFGFQRSILTGYLSARGDAAVEIDCDLQDPPSLILEFLRQWESGYRVVYGIRTGRKEGWGMNATRRLFYRLIDSLSEDELPLDAGDFRLVDRCVLEELRKIEDSQPYLRGTIAALGFDQIGIPYHRADFGQTLGKYGMPEGPFLVLPIVGPDPPRDLIGDSVDLFADPFLYLPTGAPLYERVSVSVGISMVSPFELHTRNIVLRRELEKGSVDPYVTMRSIYRQLRDEEIRDGVPDKDDPPPAK